QAPATANLRRPESSSPHFTANRRLAALRSLRCFGILQRQPIRVDPPGRGSRLGGCSASHGGGPLGQFLTLATDHGLAARKLCSNSFITICHRSVRRVWSQNGLPS